jgi:AICAR transformylase/IMP cyclohydrolase PurH
LRDGDVPATEVSEVTDFPECLDGRLETLHPKVLGGILARGTEVDRQTLAELHIRYVDLVCVNLYPFEATIARPGVTEAEAIENIDIGGPTMIRAAAKASDRVTVVVDPLDYPSILGELRANGDTSPATKRYLMTRVLAMTGVFDTAAADHFGKTAVMFFADWIVQFRDRMIQGARTMRAVGNSGPIADIVVEEHSVVFYSTAGRRWDMHVPFENSVVTMNHHGFIISDPRDGCERLTILYK